MYLTHLLFFFNGFYFAVVWLLTALYLQAILRNYARMYTSFSELILNWTRFGMINAVHCHWRSLGTPSRCQEYKTENNDPANIIGNLCFQVFYYNGKTVHQNYLFRRYWQEITPSACGHIGGQEMNAKWSCYTEKANILLCGLQLLCPSRCCCSHVFPTIPNHFSKKDLFHYFLP